MNQIQRHITASVGGEPYPKEYKEDSEMKILGIIIGWFGSGKRRRKKSPTKLEKISNTELLDAVMKSPKVLAVVIDKYGELPACHEEEFEPVIKNIRDKFYKKAVQAAMRRRRRELVAYIDGIIDEVMGTGDSKRRQHKKEPVKGIGTGEQPRLQSSIYRQRPTGRGPEMIITPRTFLESLKFIAFLGKLASQQARNGGGDMIEKVYVVEQNGKPVEMSEKEYLGYALKQYLRQGKKKAAPTPDLPRLLRVTSSQKTIEEPAEENNKGATSIESQ